MIAFFDASALVKRYIEEPGSDVVEGLLKAEFPAAARLTEVEVSSAIERRCREGSFGASERDRAIGALRRDIKSFLMVELTAAVVERSLGLLARYPLRTGDALQLASCVELRERLEYPVTFVAFDRRLNEAAGREGLALASPGG
ncbi:MAG: type II toxin-antitoxin system VapC family toxin [Acidobacteriota bacterium]